jgi:multicomponent K+:H+ antiporter subunit G
MSLALEVLVSAALVVGGVFGLIGSFGLLKLRGAMQRLHAPTKATTVGVGCTLIASAFTGLATTGAASWHEVLVTAFLFLTAPLTALYLAKTHLLTIPPGDLPPTGTPRDWANRDWADRDAPG